MNHDPLLFFWLVFKATLLSSGGTGNLPSLHDDLVASRAWLSGGQMAEAVSIGQLAPGPTGLWVASLGYRVDGVPGALIATIAVALPPLLALGVARLYRRVRHHPAIEGFMRGLGLAVIGVGAIILWRLLAASAGIAPRSLLIALAGAALMASRRVPVIAILLLAGTVAALWR